MSCALKLRIFNAQGMVVAISLQCAPHCVVPDVYWVHLLKCKSFQEG